MPLGKAYFVQHKAERGSARVSFRDNNRSSTQFMIYAFKYLIAGMHFMKYRKKNTQRNKFRWRKPPILHLGRERAHLH